MKLLPQKGIAFGGLAIALVTSPANAATLAIVPAPPTVDLLVSRGDEAPLGGGGSQATFGFRNADAAGTEGSRGRGQSFVINSTAGATYDISSLALSLAGGAGTAIRPDGDLTLTIFEYTGTGATAADQVNDTANWTTQTGGTSGTQIFSGSFPIAANMAFSGADVATFNFATGELQLDDDVAYGFFLQYTLDTVVGLGADVTIAFDADNNTNAATNPAGLLLNTGPATIPANAANGVSATRDLNYFITGTVVTPPVPEPSSLALLALGGLAFARRRNR